MIQMDIFADWQRKVVTEGKIPKNYVFSDKSKCGVIGRK